MIAPAALPPSPLPAFLAFRAVLLSDCHKASARHLPAANPVLPLLYPSAYPLVFFSASELCWHDQQLAKL